MEVTPFIVATLEEHSDRLLEEVFFCLPEDVREFHQHIPSGQCKSGDARLAIERLQRLRSAQGHMLRTDTEKRVHGYLLILFERGEDSYRQALNIFQDTLDAIRKEQGGGNVHLTSVPVCVGRLDAFVPGRYLVSEMNAHGRLASKDELDDKLKHYLLMLLSADLNHPDIKETALHTFFPGEDPGSSHAKSFDLVVDGLPLFRVRRLFEQLCSEEVLASLLADPQQVDEQVTAISDRAKLIASLEVDKYTPPNKGSLSIHLPFFAGSGTRTQLIARYLGEASADFRRYITSSSQEAKKQRTAYEEQATLRASNTRAIDLLGHPFGRLASLRTLIHRLRHESGPLHQLMKEKQKAIQWPTLDTRLPKQRRARHPIWLLALFLLVISALPFVGVDLEAVASVDRLKWGGGGILLLAGYLAYSWFDLTRVSRRLRAEQMERLQSVDKFFAGSFSSFLRFLELTILQTLGRDLDRLNAVVAANQSRVAAVYLHTFPGGDHYREVKKRIETWIDEPGDAGIEPERLRNDLELLLTEDPSTAAANLVRALDAESDHAKVCRRYMTFLEEHTAGSPVRSIIEYFASDPERRGLSDTIRAAARTCVAENDLKLAHDKLWSIQDIQQMLREPVSGFGKRYFALLSQLQREHGKQVSASAEALWAQRSKMAAMCPNSWAVKESRYALFVPEQIVLTVEGTTYHSTVPGVSILCEVYDMERAS
jgi:hypothetical protein